MLMSLFDAYLKICDSKYCYKMILIQPLLITQSSETLVYKAFLVTLSLH